MQAENLTEVAATQVATARAAGSGRSTQTVVGGQGRMLRQAVMALAAGHGLGEHESPREATLQVLVGRVRLTAGEQTWEGSAGDHLIIPDVRHDLVALEDAAVLLTVLTGR
nr:cupin domain-containing protein [Ruania zhangjianzhongii]